jgi:hypothetical protein
MKKMNLLWALVVFMALFSFCSCAKKAPEVSIIERTSTDGTVSVELPTPQTFERYDLPPTVEAEDVAAVITLHDDPMPMLPDGSKAAKKTKAAERIVVMKDGRVLAGKEAALKIEEVEKVKPSYAWAWWSLLVLVIAIVVAYITGKLTPLLSAILGFFKR